MSQEKKFKVITLGCRTNQYESQGYIDQLKAIGYTPASENEKADICIVNTCTVTQTADQSSKQQVKQLIQQNPGSKIVVTGCAVERSPVDMLQIKGVSHVVSNKQKESLLKIALPEEKDLPEFSIKNFEAHTRAFVKVQDGCNSFCSYCIIPFVRGRSRSRRVDDILKEIKDLVANGYKEVVITGINVGDFDGAPQEGEDPVKLATLIRAVDQIEGIKRIRVSSIDPDEVDEDLLKAIIEGKHTCPSMHIVLQSGSNAVLKRMNRKYTRQMFIETINRLSAACPDFTFTTDVIVGFPGESELDHQDTLDILKQVRFAKVHMFPYSEREKTKAATFTNKVPKAIINERKHEVLRVAEHISFELREHYVGRKMDVLLESPSSLGSAYFSGHTENFLLVHVDGANLRSNDIVSVELIENRPEGLIGKIIK